MKPLFALLGSDARQIDVLSIQQIIALCGDGKLSDASATSTDFREYLQIAKSQNLFRYAQTCLEQSFDREGMVLQDLVNELGRRLDYTVRNGLYQGRRNSVGFDGIWVAPDGDAIVVEVKTTDAYRINLDKIAGYREELIAQGVIPSQSSVLLVVGRQDTGDLEAQVRGSKHAWTFRIISVDALIKLVSMKENAELASVAKIHELLVPFEYTRLDRIIEIAFTVAEETSAAVTDEEHMPEGAGDAVVSTEIEQAGEKTQDHTPGEVIDEVRADIVAVLSKMYSPLVKRSRALYWSADKEIRAAITISKEYKGGDYWYAYHPGWDSFLGDGTTGLFVLGCIGRDEAFALPFAWIHSKLPSLYTTQRADKMYWHISLWPSNNGAMALHARDGAVEIVDKFKIKLTT